MNRASDMKSAPFNHMAMDALDWTYDKCEMHKELIYNL
jgi:hypothetical protein